MGRGKQRVVGVDVSAQELHVAVHGGDSVHTFPNSAEGHRKLVASLKKRGGSSRVVLESTGTYGLDLALLLHQQRRFVVHYLNPAMAAAFARAHLGRAKTDSIDARLLAQLGATLELKPWVPPSTHALGVRSLTRRIRTLTNDRTREKNRLAAARAAKIHPRALLDDMVLHIAELDTRIEDLRTKTIALAQQDEEYAEQIRLLTTIKGIAEATAVEMLGEMRCMPGDLTGRQLVAQAGLDPRPRESGTHQGKRRISKMGSKHLRATMYMAAFNVVKWSPSFRAIHEKLVGRGKHNQVAYIAVARRLLVITHAMLRTGTAFDPSLVGAQRSPAAAAA